MENWDQTFHMCSEILQLCFSLNKALHLSNSLNALEISWMWGCIGGAGVVLLHFPTPMYTRAHAHRHTCSRSYITHPHMHVCAWTCTCVHRYRHTHSPTQTPICSHIYTHARIVTHVHTLILSMHTCAHMHRLPPHAHPHAHPHACTHT